MTCPVNKKEAKRENGQNTLLNGTLEMEKEEKCGKE